MSKTLIFFLDITSSAFVKAIVCIFHFIYMGTFALTNCKDNLYFAKLQNFSAKFAISILHFILFTQTQIDLETKYLYLFVCKMIIKQAFKRTF